MVPGDYLLGAFKNTYRLAYIKFGFSSILQIVSAGFTWNLF